MKFKPKPRAWICSCGRKNDPDEHVCGFCQHPRAEKEAKKKNSKPYDELVLWPIFSQFIRLRDTDKNGFGFCITCGKPVFWKRADAGHGIPRQHKATKYNEQNNNIQCKPCNGFEGGMREAYKVAMDKKYGVGTWDKMLVASKGVSRLGKVEIDILAEYYTGEVEKLMMDKEFSI